MKFLVLGLATFLGIVGYTHRASSNATQITQTERPLLLEANEGEQRVRRVPARGAGVIVTSAFTIKVDSRNGGSRNLMFFTDKFQPGAAIPIHRHLNQDEIIYIEHGAVHAIIGDQARDVHAGGTIFIPHNTWISVKGIGRTTISDLAFFSGSDYDAYVRCSSVPIGQKAGPITRAQRRECAKAGKAEYRGL